MQHADVHAGRGPSRHQGTHGVGVTLGVTGQQDDADLLRPGRHRAVSVATLRLVGGGDLTPTDPTPADQAPTDLAPPNPTPTDLAPPDLAPTDLTPTEAVPETVAGFFADAVRAQQVDDRPDETPRTRLAMAPVSSAPIRIFLSGVKSVTHLAHAASYLRCLLSTSSGPVTLVDLGVGAFMGRYNVTDDDVRRQLAHDERITLVRPPAAERWQARRGERLIYVAVGAPGIKPYVRLRAANPTRRVHVVVIDEGLGSYGNWRTRLEAWQRQGARGPWPWIRSIAVATASRALTDERWALYRQGTSGWYVDNRVATALRGDHLKLRPPEPRVVFLSQPWVELGQLSEETYLTHLHAVERACAAAGLSLRIRPHPAEDPRRYRDFDVDTARGPSELDASIVSATAVLGATSTALLNIAAVHGTPAIRLSLLPESTDLEIRLSPEQESLLDAFLPPAQPVAALPGLLAALR